MVTDFKFQILRAVWLKCVLEFEESTAAKQDSVTFVPSVNKSGT